MPTATLANPATLHTPIPSRTRLYVPLAATGPWVGQRCQLCDAPLQLGQRFVCGPAEGDLHEAEWYCRPCFARAYYGEAGS